MTETAIIPDGSRVYVRAYFGTVGGGIVDGRVRRERRRRARVLGQCGRGYGDSQMTETAIIPDGSRVYVRIPRVAGGPAIVLWSELHGSVLAYRVRMVYGGYELWAWDEEMTVTADE